MKTNRVITFTVVFTILIIIFFGAFTLKLSASAKKDVKYTDIHYKTIQIEENDSLWSISEKYASTMGLGTREYIKKLKEINHLSSSLIKVGSYLLVPIGI